MAGPGQAQADAGAGAGSICGVYDDRVNQDGGLGVSLSEARRKRDAEPRLLPASGTGTRQLTRCEYTTMLSRYWRVAESNGPPQVISRSSG